MRTKRLLVAVGALALGGTVGVVVGSPPGEAHTCAQVEDVSPPSTVLVVPPGSGSCDVDHPGDHDCTSTSPDGHRVTVCVG